MALPKPNPDILLNWINLGSVVPKDFWQSYKIFTENSNTFKLTAFSLKEEYYRYCFLRIKYNIGSNPIYSKWVKIYPNPITTLYNLPIDFKLKDVPKTIESLDYFKVRMKKYFDEKKVDSIPNDLNWSLKIEFLDS